MFSAFCKDRTDSEPCMESNSYSKPYSAWYVAEANWVPVTEVVAVEESVGIYYDGQLIEEASCTPEDLKDLAIGYLYTSGTIECLDDVSCVEDGIGEAGLEVRVLSSNQRRIAESPRLPLRADATAGEFRVSPEAVHRASAALLGAQRMHRGTGATHAAAFADLAGGYRCIREDIGRHNAVDKLIGALLGSSTAPASGFVHLSSRCALDLAKKCAVFGIRLISTVSAPTSAVIEFADRQGIALCAFSRNGHFTVYTHPENLSR